MNLFATGRVNRMSDLAVRRAAIGYGPSRFPQRSKVTSAFYLLIVLFLLVRASPKCYGQAQLQVVRPVHDFGEVDEGADLAGEFELRNVGDKPLVINKVSVSCNYGAVILSATEFAANHFGIVSATFSTNGLKGFVRRGLVLETNDPTHASAKIIVQATVIPAFLVEPEVVTIKGLHVGDATATSVTFSSPMSSWVEILDVSSETSLDVYVDYPRERIC